MGKENTKLAGLDLWGMLRRWADGIFGLDVRGLAIFRICFGILLFLDIADRSTDLVAHYSDIGTMPRSLVSPSAWKISLHMLSGDVRYEAVLFGIQAVAAIAVLFGWRTRFSLAVAWFLMCSLHTRNTQVLYGGDIVLRLFCFWGMFLPLGARWSLDALAGRAARPAPSRVLSMASVAFVAQLAWIYIVTVDLKSGAEWHNGMAVWYALSIDHFTSAIGRYLLHFPNMLKVLTWQVMVFEAVGPWVILLIPHKTVRTAAVLAFIGMHLSFEMFMEIGLFPWTSAAAWIPVLPSSFWDRLRVPQSAGPTVGSGRVNAVLASLSLVYISWWNLGSMDGKHFSVSGNWRIPAQILRVDQYWDMFAPFPLKDDGWWVIQGNRVDGKKVDMLRGGHAVDFNKPEDVTHIYKNERWRKYMRNIWQKSNAKYRAPFAAWLCRTWNGNAAPHARVKSIQLIFMREDTKPPGIPLEIHRVKLGLFPCEGYEDKEEQDKTDEKPAEKTEEKPPEATEPDPIPAAQALPG